VTGETEAFDELTLSASGYVGCQRMATPDAGVAVVAYIRELGKK